MIKVSIILLVLAQSQQFPSYSQYLESEAGKGKNYTERERKKRQMVYNHNLNQMKSITDYQVGVNQFTDMTEDQIQKNYNGLKLVGEVSLEKMEKLKTKVGNPLALDWREKGAVTSVKDTENCKSSWAFATTAYAQSKLIIEGKQSFNVDLSEQYLLSCTRNSNCLSGGYLEYAFQKLEDGGLPRQIQYPYDPLKPINPQICFTTEKVSAGSNYSCRSNLTDDQIVALLQTGPVAVVASTTEWYFYQGGIMRCNEFQLFYEAVLLVGYTPDYWILKNHWGTYWGQNGYIRVTRSRMRNANCQIHSFVCFLQKSASTNKETNSIVFLTFLTVLMIIY